MNSLEFINKEIEYWQKTINTAKSEKLTQSIIVSLNPLYKVDNATLSDYYILLIEEKINHLNQIKDKLEAWEELQKYLVLDEEYSPFSNLTYKFLFLKNACIDESNSCEEEKSLTIIKKALEVKDVD